MTVVLVNEQGQGVVENKTIEEERAFYNQDTIVALATPVGFGGVSIVRTSGSDTAVKKIINKIIKKKIRPRYAYYGEFYSVSAGNDEHILDKGIALYFTGPNSYTGESILELQCHGGPIVVDRIIADILKLGTRLAQPGEFTQRAWLNGKMDLAQVEAVSDLINATSEQAARSAVNTLTGSFSSLINNFLTELIYLRTYVEAAIDFSDQEIDFIEDGDVVNKLELLKNNITNITEQATQGVILQEGINIVIAGAPNAGKSSLLNTLCRKEEAIVTSIPGTTRDIIKTNLSIKGVPVSLIDTAGLRNTDDLVEQKGISKAYENINKADIVLLVIDYSSYNLNTDSVESIVNNLGLASVDNKKILIVFNKIDKIKKEHKIDNHINEQHLYISAKNNLGINKLEDIILNKIGFKQTTEGSFIARRRHLESLRKVSESLASCESLLHYNPEPELVAEELRLAQQYLGEITGEFTPDDLLGNIFSSFCIGK